MPDMLNKLGTYPLGSTHVGRFMCRSQVQNMDLWFAAIYGMAGGIPHTPPHLPLYHPGAGIEGEKGGGGNPPCGSGGRQGKRLKSLPQHMRIRNA